MPYLTPEDFGESDTCRSLLIPATTDWLAIVSGALTELVKTYNWEQWGALTVDECVERMQAMIDLYYEGCTSGDCELPLGGPPFRIGEGGHIEQLVDGEWVTPEGDYTIPPTEPRGEGTPEDRLCMAAANAVNVLDLMYESLSDSLGSVLSAVDAAAALVASLVGGIGLVLGAITGGQIQMAGYIFASVYAAVEWLTEDLWDEEFKANLTCMFLACASEDDDVVHFDFDCIMRNLRGDTDLLDPTLSSVRLYAQISIMLGWIGSEGLDAAGATTAVETYDCAACAIQCYQWDFTDVDGDWIPGYPDFAPPAAYISTWVDGQGWTPTGSPAIYNGFYMDFDAIEVQEIYVEWSGGDDSHGSCGNISIELYYLGSQVGLDTTTDSWIPDGELRIVGPTMCDRIIVSGNNCPTSTWAFDFMQVVYIGDPVFGEDNCP